MKNGKIPVKVSDNLHTTKKERVEVEPEVVGDLPTSWDWRTTGHVSPIKDQGKCDISWIFAPTASLEFLNA